MKTMGIIDFGSMNVDHVYSMQHFVQPGERFNPVHTIFTVAERG